MARWSKAPDDNVPVARGRLRRLLPSGIWHFHFKDAAGRWVSRSSRHRDKRGALRWAEAYSLELTDRQFRPPSPEPAPADQPDPPSVGRILVLWLRYHQEQSSFETVRSYRSIARKLLAFLNERHIRQIGAIDRSLLMDFRTWCLRQGNARTTVDNKLIALRSLFNWTVSRGWIAANPAAQSRVGERLFFDAESVRRPTYTPAECEQIITAATHDAKWVFVLLASWGLRISELAMLEWADIDCVDRWVNIRRKVTHNGVEYCPKDKEDRRLPLEGGRVTAALEHFAVRTGRQGYVVPLKTRGRRQAFAERRFLNILKDVGAQVGVATIKLTLHNFRHYFVSECADRGVPMATVMDWVGHADMKMVMYYYRLRDTTARDAMRRLLGEDPLPASPPDRPADPSGRPDKDQASRRPRRQQRSQSRSKRTPARRAPRRTAR